MKLIHVSKAEDIPRLPIDGKPTLVYWNILGLVQAIRIALAYLEVDFVDVRIDPGDPNNRNSYKGEWFSIKQDLEKLMPFPNLPYFLDPENTSGEGAGSFLSLSQSNSILRHIGRKYNWMGTNEKDNSLIDMSLDQVLDEETQMTDMAYPLGAQAMKDWYRSQGYDILRRWTQVLEGHHHPDPFITGSTFSIADCKLYVLLYKFTIIQEQLGDETTRAYMSPALHNYMKRIESLPSLQKYFESKYYQKRPLNNPAAKWVG